MSLDLTLTTLTKINSKWAKDLDPLRVSRCVPWLGVRSPRDFGQVT